MKHSEMGAKQTQRILIKEDMNIRAKEIEMAGIGTLIPHPKNNNKHSEDQIARLVKLIEYQGFRNPLVVQKGTNLVVAGHGRLLAAQKIGMKKVPVTYQEFESEAQLYAYMTSDNEISRWATLDKDMVLQELEMLGDMDIELLGIKDFDILAPSKFEMEDELKEDMNKKYIIEVHFPNDMEQMDIHDDLVSRGYIVKIK